MIVTFCGHKTIYGHEDLLRKQLYGVLNSILKKPSEQETPLTLYCGGYGGFDSLVSKVIDELRVVSNAKLEKIFVTPYILPSYKERNDFMRQFYDEILYPPIETTPYRLAIVKRNEWMVDQADVVIAYVLHSWGGAAHTLEYAERKKKCIIRLGVQSSEN